MANTYPEKLRLFDVLYIKKSHFLMMAAMYGTSVHATPQHDEEIVIVGQKKGYQAETTSSLKVDLDPLDTPGSVAIYDESLMDEQNVSSLGQVLQNDASVSAGNTRRNRERFYMRGFELEPDQSYMRNGQFHLANYMLPMELYERVEVLKGPASLLYGKSTPGGMINLTTKRAQAESHLSLKQTFGANNELKSTVDMGGALNSAESIRARVIASKMSKESWRRHKNGAPLESEKLVGALIVEADLGFNGTVSFNYDRTEDNGHIDLGSAFFETGAIIGRKDFVWDMPWARRDSHIENAGVNINYLLNDAWAVDMGYNQQYVERRTIESNWGKIYNESSSTPNYDPATGNWKVHARDTFDTFQVKTAFLDFNGDFALGRTEHKLLFGVSHVDYRKTEQQHTKMNVGTANIGDTTIVNKPSDLDYNKGDVSEFSRRSVGLYVQDYIEFSPQWHALAGVRFDQEKTQQATHNNVLPKLALIYHPSSDSSIYATYSQSFEPKDPVKKGDVNEGQILDAEKGELYELGVKREFLSGRVLASGALFNIEKNNKVVTDNNETTQGGKVRHTGLEMALDGRVSDSLSLMSNVMLLDARYVSHPTLEGNRSKDAPNFAMGVWANYNLNDFNNFHLGARYEGQKYGDSIESFSKPAHTLVDLGYSHRVPVDGALNALVRVNVKNVFNEEYLRGGCSHNAMYGEGRTVSATFQLTW